MDIDKKVFFGFITFILLFSGVAYFQFQDSVKLRIDNDKTTIYTLNDNNRFVVAGREYNKMFDGTSLMYRDVSNIRTEYDYDNSTNIFTYKRYTPFKRGPVIVDTYVFNGNIDDKTMFPLKHTIEVINGSGFIYQYEARDLLYLGDTYKFKHLPDVDDNVSFMDFEKQVKISWDDKNYYGKVFNLKTTKDKLVLRYRPESDYEVYNVRLFDPPKQPNEFVPYEEMYGDYGIGVTGKEWILRKHDSIQKEYFNTVYNEDTKKICLYPKNSMSSDDPIVEDMLYFYKDILGGELKSIEPNDVEKQSSQGQLEFICYDTNKIQDVNWLQFGTNSTIYLFEEQKKGIVSRGRNVCDVYDEQNQNCTESHYDEDWRVEFQILCNSSDGYKVRPELQIGEKDGGIGIYGIDYLIGEDTLCKHLVNSTRTISKRVVCDVQGFDGCLESHPEYYYDNGGYQSGFQFNKFTEEIDFSTDCDKEGADCVYTEFYEDITYYDEIEGFYNVSELRGLDVTFNAFWEEYDNSTYNIEDEIFVYDSYWAMKIDPIMIFTDYISTTAFFNRSTEIKNGGFILNPDPVGLWHFEGSAYDNSDYRNHGVVNGATYNATGGKYGGAYEFDGADDYISSSVLEDLSAGFSVGGWVKLAGTQTTRVVISKWSNAGDRVYWLGVGIGDNDTFQMLVQNTDETQFSVKTSETFNDGEWHYVIGAFNQSHILIYVDGELKNTTAFTGALETSSVNTVIGAPSNLFVTQFFNGSIDEVKIYPRALSLSEIQAHNSSGVQVNNSYSSSNGTAAVVQEFLNYTGNQTGLVGSWIMDYTDARDESGSGNNGTFNGGLASCNNPGHTNSLGQGSYGYACDFDGVDDYIEVAEYSAIDFERTDSFSISQWVKLDDVSGTTFLVAKSEANFKGFNTFLNGDDARFSLINSIAGGNMIIIESNIPLEIGKWYHLAFTYDGSSTATGTKIYINGVNDDSIINDALSSSILNNENLAIGADIIQGLIRVADGKMSDVKIYNRTLGFDEIQDLDAGKPVEYYYDYAKGVCKRKDAVLTCHFDEDSQTQVDSSGFGNDGAVTNATFNSSSVRDGFGGSYDFDGIDDVITINDDGIFTFSDGINDRPFSVFAWINLASISGNPTIVTKDTGINNNGREWGLSYSAGLIVQFYDDNVAGNNRIGQYAPGSPLTVGGWHHVGFTYNGNGTSEGIKIWQDGVQVDDTSRTSGSYVAMQDTTTDVMVGKLSGNYMNGSIDEVNIYDRELTLAEIVDLNNTNNPSQYLNKTNVTFDFGMVSQVNEVYNESGLVGWWRLNTGSSPEADSSGNGNTGTVSGATFKNESYCAFRDGCYDFDGVSDYINISDSDDFTFNDDFAVESWIKGTADENDMIINNWGGSSFDPTGNYIWFRIDNGTALGTATATTIVDDNKWHHIVGVRDRGNSLSIYVDGVLENYTDDIGGNIDPDQDLLIGKLGNNDRYWDGLIDSTRLYNRSLGAYEIKHNYFRYHPDNLTIADTDVDCSENSSLIGTTSGLMSYWNASLTTTNKDYTPILTELDIFTRLTRKNLAPNVTYVAPDNDTQQHSQSVDFVAIFTDPDGDNMTTELWIDDELNQTNTSVENGTQLNITKTLAYGEHTWYFKVSDASLTTTGENRTINITNVDPTIALNAPDDDYTMINGFILVNFTCTDGDGDACNTYLTINGSIVQTNLSVPSGTDVTYNWTSYGTYDWNVTFNDAISANQTSATRNFSLVQPTAEANFTLWNGSAWIDAYSDYMPLECFRTDINCVPNNKNNSQSIYQICNIGNLNGSAVYMNMNQTYDRIDLFCDTDNVVAGAKVLNTSNTTIYTSIAADACINVWCWANYTNPLVIGDFDTFAYVVI
jgi:hypothetical protein